MALPQLTATGNLTGDPELRFTPAGKAVANFTVACNKKRKNEQTGEWVDGDTCFLAVNAWEEKAEAIAEQLQRGSKVVVTGTLRQRDYEDRDGNKRHVYEVQAYDVALVVQRPKAERERPAGPSSADPWATPAPGTDPPF